MTLLITSNAALTTPCTPLASTPVHIDHAAPLLVISGNQDQTDATTMSSYIVTIMLIKMRVYELNKVTRNLQLLNYQNQTSLAFQLQLNALNKKRESIESTFNASITSATCSMTGAVFGGVGLVGELGYGVSNGGRIGKYSGDVISGIGQAASAGQTRNAEEERAISELQTNSAQSYEKNMDASLSKTQDFFKQWTDAMSSIMAILGQSYAAMVAGR